VPFGALHAWAAVLSLMAVMDTVLADAAVLSDAARSSRLVQRQFRVLLF